MKVITVLIKGEQEIMPSPSAKPAVETKDTPVPNAKKEVASPNSLAYSVARQITKAVVSNIVSNSQYYVGKYNQLTENYSGQNLVQNAQSIIGTISGISSSAIGAAQAMSFAGPVGMAVGAALAVASSLVKEGIKIKNSYNEAVSDILKTTYSNYFYGERAGSVNNGRDTNE